MAVAVTILFVITIINLALLVGLIRRVSEHEINLAKLGGTATTEGPSVGTKVDEFELQALDGSMFDSSQVDGGILLGIFSPSCDTCASALLQFAAFAASESAVLVAAIIASDLAVSARYVEDTVGSPALLVLAAPDTPDVRSLMVDRLSLRGFPLYVKLDRERFVTAAGTELERVLTAG